MKTTISRISIVCGMLISVSSCGLLCGLPALAQSYQAERDRIDAQSRIDGLEDWAGRHSPQSRSHKDNVDLERGMERARQERDAADREIIRQRELDRRAIDPDVRGELRALPDVVSPGLPPMTKQESDAQWRAGNKTMRCQKTNGGEWCMPSFK